MKKIVSTIVMVVMLAGVLFSVGIAKAEDDYREIYAEYFSSSCGTAI